MLSNRKDSSNIARRIEAIERGSPPPTPIGTNTSVHENNNIVLDSGAKVDSADAILENLAKSKPALIDDNEELNSADSAYLQQRKKMVDNVVHCLGLYGTFFIIINWIAQYNN